MAVTTNANSHDLLERQPELDRIDVAIEAACEGEGSTLLIEGPAGIGKTTLLREGAELARGRMTALSARATQLEREFPFGAVRQLLEPPLRSASAERRSELLDGAAARAAPALGLSNGGSAGADRGFATLNGLYWLVCDLADEQPLLIALDDAHWADRDSLRFLAFLAPRLAELPALLLLAARSEEWQAGGQFAATASDPAAQAVIPAPLSAEATATLVDARFDAPVAPEFARACHATTGGNPFYLHALLDELRRDRVTPSEQAAERVLGLGPHAVSRVIVARLGVLSPAAPRLVSAVAVLGDDADPEHAARLARLDAAEARAAAAELAEAAILEPGERLSFVHPIIRNAVYEDIGRRERATLHRRAAEQLASDAAAAERVPGHLLAVEPAGQPAVVATLREAAAGALRRGAIDTAVAYLRRALAEPPADAERAGVLIDLGKAEIQALDPSGVEHLEAAADLAPDPLQRAAALGSLTFFRYLNGDAAGAAAAARDALAQIPPGGGRGAEMQLLLNYCLPGRGVPELVDEVVRLLDQPRTGPEGGATPAEAMRLMLRAFDAFLRGDAELAAERLRAANDQVAQLRGGGSLPFAAWLGWFQSITGQRRDAEASIQVAIVQARQQGSKLQMAVALDGRGYLRWTGGDLLGAIGDAETAVGLSGTESEWAPATVMSRVIWGACLTERGDEAGAAAALDIPDGVERRLRGFVGWPWVPFGRARLALARGEWAAARDEALACGERLLAIEATTPDYLPWRSLAARALGGLGERDRALELAREEAELARETGSARVTGVALATVGAIEGGEEEIAALREALDLLAGSPARLEHARALVCLGSAIRRSGRRADAREPLTDGMEQARECGAVPLADRAYTELRATGARPRKPVYVGVDALTPSELRVARMAAEGMTNREIAETLFVTVKTVEFHLGQTYRKLEISSREELAGVV